ncbi:MULTISPECIES: hypothetical protein [unclassified Phaeobacter]|uniref:RipA family octameric membrane protein n=1 Tax=unclassified Phaeobacter TaxID=2621772 RepID=UPI003A85171A
MSVEENLASASKDEYGSSYQDHILEIYKMYVDSADSISARRQSANSFYLSVNTAIIGAAGYINEGGSSYGWAVSLAGVMLCIAWQRAVRAYKDLNSGKFKVIHEIEKKLPISVYAAEWDAIGRGKDKKLYLPFTRIEVWIPRIFITLHLIMFVTSLPWETLLESTKISN